MSDNARYIYEPQRPQQSNEEGDKGGQLGHEYEDGGQWEPDRVKQNAGKSRSHKGTQGEHRRPQT